MLLKPARRPRPAVDPQDHIVRKKPTVVPESRGFGLPDGQYLLLESTYIRQHIDGVISSTCNLIRGGWSNVEIAGAMVDLVAALV